MVTVIERTQTGRRTLVHSCRLTSKFLDSALVQMELKQGALVSVVLLYEPWKKL